MKYDIISIGSAIRDVFLIERDFEIHKNPKKRSQELLCIGYGSKVEVDQVAFDIGGGGVNTATTFARMGLKCALVSQVADDDNGRLILDKLKERRVNTSHVKVVRKGFTGYSTILAKHTGDRTVLVARGVSASLPRRGLISRDASAKWACLTSLAGNLPLLENAVAQATKKKMRIAWVPGSRELALGARKLRKVLRAADVLCLNREEAALLAGKSPRDVTESFRSLAAMTNGHVCITDGLAGAYLRSSDAPDRVFRAPVCGPKAKNSLGAGDAFASGFVAGLARKMTPKDAFRLALLNSGSVVSSIGASEGLLAQPPTKRALGQAKVRNFSSI